MNYLRYALAPFALLIVLALSSCVLSYVILMLAGDILPLHKLVSKGTLVLLILSIFPLRRYLSLSWADIGYAPKNIFFKQLVLGLGLGLLTLLPIIFLLFSIDVNIWDVSKEWTVPKLIGRLLIALFLGLLISFAEESIFRGLLLTSFRKKMAVSVAIFFSATYYSALHFLKSTTHIPYEKITFSSSFQLFGEAFTNYYKPEFVTAFIALVMVGIFLALIRTQVKNSLGLCIGYHASWVWVLKMNRDVLNINHQSEYFYLVSNYDGVIGLLVSGWMFLASAAYLAYLYKIKE
ncbi:MAG: CPBP family intramembrane metalloprotease [Methylococcaceae bacterium]|nr:CPBP family intramembrane metalloprotease [Methylococcaceae bacterium]